MRASTHSDLQLRTNPRVSRGPLSAAFIFLSRSSTTGPRRPGSLHSRRVSVLPPCSAAKPDFARPILYSSRPTPLRYASTILLTFPSHDFVDQTSLPFGLSRKPIAITPFTTLL
ncbi:hypothetical protein CC79DRAFT_1074782 [Sarocladium strictum]